MSALIDWGNVGEIFVESLAAGVVVVGAFALAARLVAAGSNTDNTHRHVAVDYAVAAVCFLIALAAVAYGVYFTIDK